MPSLTDIAILGGTPAGYAAAAYLAERRQDVAVIEAPRREAESSLADWVPGDFFHIEGLAPKLAAKSNAVMFKRVVYHSADLLRQIEHQSPKAAGYFLRSEDLAEAMKARALKAGAKFRTTKSAPLIRLNEEAVHLQGSSESAATDARILILAHGTPGQAASDLAMPVLSVREAPLVVAGLEVPLEADEAETMAGTLHVAETTERNEFGMFFALRDSVHVRLMSFSRAAGNRAAELSALVANLQRVGLLPSKLAYGRARGAVWHPPAGIAVETETHVAKRCLLAGTAGGFADSITGQTLFPAVKSAIIAARTAEAALEAPDVQAALNKFKTAWRQELGEYLRPPSTSLQMLLPLLFVNKRIVGRFTAALLFGENI